MQFDCVRLPAACIGHFLSTAQFNSFGKVLEWSISEAFELVFNRIVNILWNKLNNKIAKVIHRACGYREVEYLLLNLRQLTARAIPL